MCPAVFSHTHARRTYDRALRTLPPSLHHRIWVRYLLWAEEKGGSTCVAVYRRYLAVDPSVTEHYVSILLSPSNSAPRPLEAAKLLLSLARKAAKGEYISPEGKSPYQLLGEWLDVVEKFPEEIGINVEQTIALQEGRDKAETEAAEAAKEGQEPASLHGPLIRIAGPAVPVDKDGKPLPAYNQEEDPASLAKLDVEKIVQKDGLEVYKDQAGRLWTGLATFWIKRGEFDRAKHTFEAGIASALTLRDFGQIFDAYSEFSESLISALVNALEEQDEDDDEDDAKETEQELDERMKNFEELMDRRPFLVNDVLIRRNPNDVQEWEKRVALWGNDDEKVCQVVCTCFNHSSLDSIRSQKHIRRHSRPSAPKRLPRIYIVSSSTSPSSMRRVVRQERQRKTWTALGKYSNVRRKLTSEPLRILRRYGANGLRWS